MLKEIREKQGLSQSQLAKKANISLRTLQHYEQQTSNIDNAKLDTLINLAVALNCNIRDILTSPELKEKCNLTKL